MVYESDFYTTRRPYSSSYTSPRPYVSSYNVSTPRHYVVRDYPDTGLRSAQEQYSYSYVNNSSTSSTSTPDRYGGYSRPQRESYTTESRVKRETGPYGNYSTERTSRSSSSGLGPGGYHSSYETTTSGRLPGGTTYRHFSYRV